MTEITEVEMVERMVGGVREAADCVHDMCRAMAMRMPPAPSCLIRFRSRMKDASGSTGQLAHAQQNPEYLAIRDRLETMVSLVTQTAMSRDPRAGMALAQAGAALDLLWRAAAKIAVAKPVARQDALTMLDERQAAVH